jgi:hypothetical protein
MIGHPSIRSFIYSTRCDGQLICIFGTASEPTWNNKMVINQKDKYYWSRKSAVPKSEWQIAASCFLCCLFFLSTTKWMGWALRARSGLLHLEDSIHKEGFVIFRLHWQHTRSSQFRLVWLLVCIYWSFVIGDLVYCCTTESLIES